MSRRPSRAKAHRAVVAFLADELGCDPSAVPGFSLIADGGVDAARGKCGWAFTVLDDDTTSYVHEDLRIEWYGTAYDHATETLRAVVERPHVRHLWGKPHTVTPRLVDEVFGDGMALLGICPTNRRPEYYVVRIDSAWAADLNGEFRDHLDPIKDAIEAQYGCVDSEDDPLSDDFPQWPIADFTTGCDWFAMDWPAGMAPVAPPS